MSWHTGMYRPAPPHPANFLATIEEEVHPVPFRTRQLSPPSPMILRYLDRGKVGRCQIQFKGRQNTLPAFLASGAQGLPPGHGKPFSRPALRGSFSLGSFDETQPPAMRESFSLGSFAETQPPAKCGSFNVATGPVGTIPPPEDETAPAISPLPPNK